MHKQRISIALLLTAFILVMSACSDSKDSSLDTGQYSQESASEIIVSSLLTDEELENRLFYLFDFYVFPVYWWTGGGITQMNVNEFGDALENTPENTVFHQVHRFNSIEEMKRATEQAVTKEYAEKNLYPNLEEHNQFLERDGKLYINTEMGSGSTAFRPISVDVLSKTDREAILSVVFEEPYGEQETHEIMLCNENGGWKLNNFPYYEFISG